MKKAVLAAVAVVVLAFAIYRLWPSRGKVTPEMVNRPRVCLECGHRFEAPTDPILLECPQCHKRAGARVYFYICRKCKERFEAYHERPTDPSLTTVDPIKPPELEFQREGGPWVRSVKALGPFKCPKCGSAEVGPPLPR